jgi:hypothetical protein
MDINAARAAEATEGGLDKLADLLNWRDSKRFSEAERVALDTPSALPIPTSRSTMRCSPR